MEIKILGTRAQVKAKTPQHALHTGILIDKKILIDLGEEEFLSENPQYIFLTHLHPDHAYFEFSGKIFNQDTPAIVFAPEPHKKVEKIIVIDENAEFTLNGYKILPIPVIHSLKVKSLGYIIKKNGKRIFFSGDVAWIKKQPHAKLGKLDLVITEGSYKRKGGMIRRDKKSGKIFGHTGLPDLVKMFKPHTGHIVIVHLGTWFLKDPVKGAEIIRNYGDENLRVEASYDGQILQV